LFVANVRCVLTGIYTSALAEQIYNRKMRKKSVVSYVTSRYFLMLHVTACCFMLLSIALFCFLLLP